MKLLVDTQAFLWFINGSRALSTRGKASLENEAYTVYFSAASYWEICIKISLGKLQLATGWQATIFDQLVANNFIWLPIKREHCEGIGLLPWMHRDPFDRLLIAQAICDKLVLVTNDKNVRAYSVPTLW